MGCSDGSLAWPTRHTGTCVWRGGEAVCHVRGGPSGGLGGRRGAMSVMERLQAACNPTRRRLLLKALSLGAGIFLVVAGIVGCTAPILGGGLVYFIGAIYAIIFGLIVLTVEVSAQAP